MRKVGILVKFMDIGWGIRVIPYLPKVMVDRVWLMYIIENIENTPRRGYNQVSKYLAVISINTFYARIHGRGKL